MIARILSAMNRLVLGGVFALLGIIVIVLAVASATVWKPSDTAQVKLSAPPSQPYVITEPGVLGVIDSDVTITATATGQTPVLIAVGRKADVKAWLGKDPYLDITGLSSWTLLESHEVTQVCDAQDQESPSASPSSSAASAPTGQATASAQESADSKQTGCTELTESGANPNGSDLWLTQKSGTGSVSLSYDASHDDLIALIAADGTISAPTVSLSWPRKASTPWLIPGLILGALLLLGGVFLLAIEIQLNLSAKRRHRGAIDHTESRATADSVATAMITTVGDPHRELTRRERRDRERALSAGHEWVDPRTGAVHRHGVDIPQIPAAVGEEVSVDYSSHSSASHGFAGPARGSAVVPGLDEDRTAQLRARRALDETASLVLADEADLHDDLQAGGPARGSAVVPGLDEDHTARLRAWRALDETASFVLIDTEESDQSEHIEGSENTADAGNAGESTQEEHS